VVTGRPSSPEPDPARAANVLGALVLALADRMAVAVEESSAHSESGAAALSALQHFLRNPSIDLLRQVLGLTHSGAVRLVDRLEHDGLVRREAGPDGRITVVRLTDRGRRAATRVTTARAELLGAAMDVLPPADQEQLTDLAGRVLVGMRRGAGATRWTCRLCDTGACGRLEGRCPVAGESPPTF
jgi:DNA-binding MarR family transcriptional regulator